MEVDCQMGKEKESNKNLDKKEKKEMKRNIAVIMILMMLMMSGCAGFQNPFTPNKNWIEARYDRYLELTNQWQQDFSYGVPEYGQFKYELCKYQTEHNRAMIEHCGDLDAQKKIIDPAMQELELKVQKIYEGRK